LKKHVNLEKIVYISLLSLVIAVSAYSFIYSLLIYSGAYTLSSSMLFRVLSFLLIIALFASFSAVLGKELDVKVRWMDYVAAFLCLIPFFILRVFSPLPLVDDLRYIGSALLQPNGFYSLVGYSVVAVAAVSHADVLAVYWFLVLLSLYALFLVIINMLREFLEWESWKEVAISAFIIIYTPSFISSLIIPELLTKPYEVNRLIFDIWQFHYFGRSISLDPNLLKNVAVLLASTPLFMREIKRVSAAILTAFLWFLAYLYHPLDALTTILIATVYLSIFYMNLHRELEAYFTKVILCISVLLIFALQVFGYSLFLLYLPNNLMNILLNLLVLPSVIAIGLMIAQLARCMFRNRILVMATVAGVFLIATVKVPVELSLQRFVAPKVLVLWGYYLVMLGLSALYKHKSMKSELAAFLLVPGLLVYLVVGSVYLLPFFLKELGYATVDIYRYIQVLSRTLTTPAYGLSLTIPFVPTIIKFLGKKDRLLKSLIVVVSITNMLFSLYTGVSTTGTPGLMAPTMRMI